MKNLKYIILALGLIVLAWLLPALYELVFPRTDKTPFVVYSCLDSTFIRFETANKQVRYIDFRGQEFSKSQADSLLPLFAFRQLVAEGRLPDSLYGVALTPKLIQQNSFHFKTSPKQLNKPAVGLYTLLESASGRVDLSLPPDVFRLTKEGLEFIDCETNQINKAKSLSFSRELTKNGFVFPVQLIWGNSTTRKDYDNGFLLTDANDRLFQLKMVKGTPFVREISTENTQGWKQVFTVEPANRALIGLAVSNDNQLFVVTKEGKTVAVGIDAYDPQEMQITIVGDLFHWTITEYTASDSRYYAVDARTFEQVARTIVPDPERPLAQKVERILLPVRLRFTSWRTQLVTPNINDD
ncbi:MAG: DUF4857 domain-containing protein [Paludibacteraceae bacterium]|nr:DUF4857 domain-containing protein [Paludibacteraceae bacterium]